MVYNSKKIYFFEMKNKDYLNKLSLFVKMKNLENKNVIMKNIKIININYDKSYGIYDLKKDRYKYFIYVFNGICQSCRKSVIIPYRYLLNGKKIKCSMHNKCYNRTYYKSPEEYIGKKFGTFIVRKIYKKIYREYRQDYEYQFICQCECGNIKILKSSNLLRTQFNPYCGKKYHVFSKNEFYSLWIGIHKRCSNKNDPYYGRKGIYVCNEWKFDPLNKNISRKNLYNFSKYMYNLINEKGFSTWKETSKNGYSIDRIDNDGPYAPWNCRLATWYQQNRNKKDVLKNIKYKNEILFPADIANIFNRKYHEIYHLKFKKYNYDLELYFLDHPEDRIKFENFIKEKNKNEKLIKIYKKSFEFLDSFFKTIINKKLEEYIYKDSWKILKKDEYKIIEKNNSQYIIPNGTSIKFKK